MSVPLRGIARLWFALKGEYARPSDRCDASLHILSMTGPNARDGAIEFVGRCGCAVVTSRADVHDALQEDARAPVDHVCSTCVDKLREARRAARRGVR